MLTEFVSPVHRNFAAVPQRKYDELWMPLISDLTVGSTSTHHPLMILPPIDIQWMKTRSPEFAMVATMAILWSIRGVIGIRFVIHREECFSHNVEYDGDTIHLSFVVIKSEGSWHYAPDGVDLVIHDFRDKTSEKFEFVAHRSGIHRFCFTNKSPYHETVDFDVHEAHFSYHDQHAKHEHLNPLLQQISISLLIFSI
ncbi:Transmembrane emp24 domain-containing protein p24beta2 [Camellia lanceoleosa]|uniref:Transmembrane emp24 domain-containing protein p24beta2 n=1 Tax=Camellia lanceoleosa TaxID=1840588 RepID=A0ACC0FVF3_9ERIC|nr:Transmembrane emp24 domain-containing protein p24beta2 [Camellia lanceoleosa]